MPKDLPIDDTNYRKQHLLQTMFPTERLKISFIQKEKNGTFIEQVVQANLKDSYYTKLRNVLKTGYLIEKIDSYSFSNLLLDSRNCIYQFSQLLIAESLNLLVIRNVHDQITSEHLNC